MLLEKKMVGKSIQMSLANNKTVALWQDFMQHKKNIENTISADLYSMQVYDDSLDFKDFNSTTKFVKWAAIEVLNFDKVPNVMKTYTLKGGLYAVFIHKGTVSEFQRTFQYIFREWLPKSQYNLDNRVHFELLGKKYKNKSSDSEEEVWIPIKKKEEGN